MSNIVYLKKYLAWLLAVAGLLGVVVSGRADTVTIQIDAGLLETAPMLPSLQTTPEPQGGLLQLIASPSGIFGAPTSTSYVTGDNVLVQSFAMNYFSNVTGETNNTLGAIPLSTAYYTLTAGEALTLRFYPSLTFLSMPSAPTLGTSYGQVRSSVDETFQSGQTDSAQTPWVVPASGDVDLYYKTVSDGGVVAADGYTYSNASAEATNIVLVGLAVPEPSTYALLGFAAVLLSGLWLREKRPS